MLVKGCLQLNDFPLIDYQRIVQFLHPLIDQQTSHINLTKRRSDSESEAEYVGLHTLANREKTKYIYQESEWVENRELIRGSYLEQVLTDLRDYVSKYFLLEIGRARVNILHPKMCLTAHRDLQEHVRFHIPLVTNEHNYFINDNELYQMLSLGRLYMYNVSQLHTAVNASRERRIHLVFSTFRKQTQ